MRTERVDDLVPKSSLEKPAVTSVPISEVLEGRFSPRIYDPAHSLSDSELLAILEAGRWAPSGNNSQPWAFIVGRRGDEDFSKITSALTGFNQSWAPNASALIVAVGSLTKPDGSPMDKGSRHLNVGLATSQMVIQAEAMGLKAHYMGGFIPEVLSTEYHLDAFEPVIVLAIGQMGDLSEASIEMQEREMLERTRKPLSEIILRGLPEAEGK